MGTILQSFSQHRFTVISWGVTGVIVAALLGSALWWTKQGGTPGAAAAASASGSAASAASSLPLPPAQGQQASVPGIGRGLALKTDILSKGTAKPITYRVLAGDSIFGIAKEYNIKPESILYSNEATLNDNPSNLSPGMQLTIPPVDGLTYTWQDGDTLDKVADEFKADLNGDKKIDEKDAALLRDAIVSYPSNNLDLTDPVVKPGQTIMIPGGVRELVSWLEFVPTTGRAGGSTATSELHPGGCQGGSGSPPGLWPTDGPHTVSGNGYSPSHLGIDITASSSTLVLASGGGVVVFAGFSQYGYGNVVQIDHMDGFATVYGHLSQINVSQCEVVSAGQVIGIAGSTGNSTGVHLHFEVREGNVNINPWSILQ
jgi:murein DD-endopeptidase MepM/ murein hydrolase activator NlpD